MKLKHDMHVLRPLVHKCKLDHQVCGVKVSSSISKESVSNCMAVLEHL